MQFKCNPLFKFIFLLVLIAGVGCKSTKKFNKDFNYFQTGLDSINKAAFVEPKLRENDLISIQIIAGSLRQDDAAVFNLVGGTINATTSLAASYQIDMLGYIDMPKFGKIRAAGLTKQQLADVITLKLADEVKNPLVIVKLTQFKVNVLGEIKRPGVVFFKADKANILEAIAEAGDLTEAGKREDILLMRDVNGKYETYKIDLRNTAFINSPAFQLCQNDVIYIGTNMTKLQSMDKDPNTKLSLPVILTAISTLLIIINSLGLIKR